MANVVPMQMKINNGELQIAFEIDKPVSLDTMYQVLEKSLGDSFTRIEYKKGQRVATGSYMNSKKEMFYFIMANLTFMGGTEGQHPKDLKRIQYNKTWRDFYETFSSQGRVLWFGLYSYDDLDVFAMFEPESYLKKHEGKNMISKGGHNAKYSCHIFLNDLFQGYTNGFYCKKDKNGNTVGAIRQEYLKVYFEGLEESKNPIISTIEEINNNHVKWNEWIRADRAITYMKELLGVTGFAQWRQNLWNGWYIEAIYSEYLHKNQSAYVDYIATSQNADVKVEYGALGLDLAFPAKGYHFIGDLKAVCEGGGNTLLNDEAKVKAALEKYKKIWFVIYIHEKKQGSTNGYEMVKWRNHYIREQDELEKGKEDKTDFDEMSAPLTPHSIAYTEMIIIELNEITKDKYFSVGAQWGLNSDGKTRKDKFKINKKMLKTIDDDSFVIYRSKI